MSDNLPFSSNASVNIATDDVGGIHYQIIKLATGGLDTVALVSDSNPLPINAPPSTANAAFGAVAITSASGVVRGSNPTRIGLTLQNIGTVDAYWGNNSSVTSSNGLLLVAGQSVELDARYSGPIHAITTAGTADIRFWELS